MELSTTERVLTAQVCVCVHLLLFCDLYTLDLVLEPHFQSIDQLINQFGNQ